MWIARELGAEVIGIDFSAEAVSQASERRAQFGLADRATFAVGQLDDTGLTAGSADGVICIDAFQFGRDQIATASEMRRVLRPGGTVVLTCWEPVDRDAEGLSDRMRDIDLAASLTAAGFESVLVEERPEWRNVERALWEKVMAIDPGGDPAMESSRREAERTLATFDLSKRVVATATAP
jgi:ubiquinone/menaquinone biosynthesis C-methylase UbiE